MVCDGKVGGSGFIQKAAEYMGYVGRTNMQTIKTGAKVASKAVSATPILGKAANVAAKAGMSTAEAIKLLNEQGQQSPKLAKTRPQSVPTAQDVGNTLPEVSVNGNKSYSELGLKNNLALQ